MSLKQIRISDPVQVKKRIQEFVNKRINLVLKNNTVIFCELKRINGEQLEIINMRLKRSTLPLSDIVEFYVDVTA